MYDYRSHKGGGEKIKNKVADTFFMLKSRHVLGSIVSSVVGASIGFAVYLIPSLIIYGDDCFKIEDHIEPTTTESEDISNEG